MRSESELQVFYSEAKRIMESLGYKRCLLDGTIKLNGRLSRSLGRCFYTIKLIEIQKEFYHHAEANDLMNTILHELAHQVNIHNDRHGYYWQQIAANISQNTPYKITRFAESDKLEYREKLSGYEKFKCNCCGHEYTIKLNKNKTIDDVVVRYRCKCKGSLEYIK